MKLASLALVAGGAVFGSQVGDVEVHKELHTERLVLHSKDSDRVATISSERAGIVIGLGDAQSLTTAQVKIVPEMHSWVLSFEHESGSSFKVELSSGDAKQRTSAGVGLAEASVDAFRLGEGRGMAHMRFHPGGEAVPGEACSIGVQGSFGSQQSIGDDRPHAFLRLRRQEHIADDEKGDPIFNWQNVVQIGGLKSIGPWNEDR